MNILPPYQIFPLGDTALILDYGNTLNEDINNEVITRFRQLQNEPIPGMIEALPAYSSLAVHYDVCTVMKFISPGQSVYDWMKQKLETLLHKEPLVEHRKEILQRVPVCYENEYAPDIKTLADAKGLTVEEVISIHTHTRYKVYMIGFLPGFAYMGDVDERIAMPRKSNPQEVVPGSVGIAGRQTGIYPLSSPGGWQIIGKTPLKLFDSGKTYPTFLNAGDRVEFFSITSDEFKNF